MAEDFYIQSASARAAQLEAELQAAKADLAAHRANNDVESAAMTVQSIANLENEKQNLSNLYTSYVRSQQPPPPETQEQKQAKPWSQMNYQDVWELASNSKYGSPDESSFKAGMAEVARRRARGE